MTTTTTSTTISTATVSTSRAFSSAGPLAPTSGSLNAEHLATTSLAELNDAAGLLTRVDRKYLVPPGDTQHVISHLAPRAQVLQIDGLRHFRYASTYFDTPGLDAYFLAARKRRRRYKIRTRTYPDSGLCFLEVKTNGSREATVKDRFKYDPDDADRVTPDGRLFVIERLVESGTCSSDEARTIADALVPVMDSTYSRTTLHLPHDEARATREPGLVDLRREHRLDAVEQHRRDPVCHLLPEAAVLRG